MKRRNTVRKKKKINKKPKNKLTPFWKKVIAVVVVAALVITSVCIAVYDKPKRSPNVLLTMDKKVADGVDLSEHNGQIDFEMLKNEVDFVILRVGYTGYGNGEINLDKNFRENIKSANDAGIPVGVYYYSQAIDTDEAKAEAKFVLRHIRRYDISLPVFFDFEYATKGGDHIGRLYEAGLSAEDNTQIINKFCDTIEKAGYDIGLYASSYVMKNNIKMNKLNENSYIWVADYNKKVTYSGKYELWQYSNKGRLDSVSRGKRDVDLNYWYIKK